MAFIGDRMAKSRCLLCNSDVEKSNLGSMCNPCKDRVYRHVFPAQKGANHANGKLRARA